MESLSVIFRDGQRRSTAWSGPPRSLLAEARRRAKVGSSGFRVGAVAVDDAGACYLGFNLEFGALGSTVHAEQCALIAALESGASSIDSLHVDALPCGHCRQFALEFPRLRVFVGGTARSLGRLLPEAFGPEALGSTARNPLKGARGGPDPNASLERMATDAARCSHHPYTGVPSGLAALLADGTRVTAGIVESVAYNPSVTPLAALFIQLGQLQADPSQLNEVVLCEGLSPVHDAALTELVLRRHAPRCRWRQILPPRRAAAE